MMLLQKKKCFLCFGVWNFSIHGQLTLLTSTMALLLLEMQKLLEQRSQASPTPWSPRQTRWHRRSSTEAPAQMHLPNFEPI